MGHEQDAAGEDGELLSTGDMARLGHSTLRTVRFYEQEGLLRAADRGDGRHRRFHRSELRKLEAVSGLREAGLSLDEIRELMALKEGVGCPQRASAKVCDALTTQRNRLQARIEVLQQMRDEVDAAMSEMHHCHSCRCTDFPRDCGCCERVGGQSSVTRLVWKN